MSRAIRRIVWLVAGWLLCSTAVLAQKGLIQGPPAPVVVSYAPVFFGYGGYGPSYGYGFPSFGYPAFGAPYAYAPNYWWVSPYPIADPRQDGYNPSAGYEWDSVGTLILTTFPAKARITLDGVFVGTCDRLGPFQLPVGDHSLRVAAEGYETSETVVRVEQPGPLLLDVQLKHLNATAEPAPRQ